VSSSPCMRNSTSVTYWNLLPDCPGVLVGMCCHEFRCAKISMPGLLNSPAPSLLPKVPNPYLPRLPSSIGRLTTSDVSPEYVISWKVFRNSCTNKQLARVIQICRCWLSCCDVYAH